MAHQDPIIKKACFTATVKNQEVQKICLKLQEITPYNKNKLHTLKKKIATKMEN